MKNVFASAMVISGAILIAASVIVNGNPVVYLGIVLILWGIIERFCPLLKGVFKSFVLSNDDNENDTE